MTTSRKYKLNALMRKIISKKYEGNSSALARDVGVTKQTIYSYFYNKRQLGWRLFHKIAEKSGYKIKITITER